MTHPNTIRLVNKDRSTHCKHCESTGRQMKKLPIHEPDYKGIPCPYGNPGPWNPNECDCGYWGRLEDWAKETAKKLGLEK